MPRVVTNRERVAGIRRESHTRGWVKTSVRPFLAKYSADVRDRLILGQIELDGDALPMRVCVLRNPITIYVARQNGNGIKAHVFVVGAEALFHRRRETANTRRLDLRCTKRIANLPPQVAFFG